MKFSNTVMYRLPRVSVRLFPDEDAKTELRALIRQHLSEELRKLRVSVDERIKASEDAIAKRLETAQADAGATAPASAKTKKK